IRLAIDHLDLRFTARGGEVILDEARNGVEIVFQQARVVDTDRCGLLGRVAEAEFRLVQAELLVPAARDPYLLGTGEVGDLQVLLAGRMPDEPGDRIRTGTDVSIQVVAVDTVE